MAQEDKDFIGTARSEAGITIGYVPQEPRLTEGKTVLENIEEAVAPIRNLLKQQEEIGDKMATATPEEFDELDDEDGPSANPNRCHQRLRAGSPARNRHGRHAAAAAATRLVDRLSGGERRRVALCKMLLQKPDLLLLDEPTNHLDAESVSWLERHLQEYPGTVVAVTHDRYFLDNVAKWILELDRGRGYPVRGQLLVVARAEEVAAGDAREVGIGPAESAGPRTGMGANESARAAWPRARPVCRPTRSWLPRNTRSARTKS